MSCEFSLGLPKIIITNLNIECLIQIFGAVFVRSLIIATFGSILINQYSAGPFILHFDKLFLSLCQFCIKIFFFPLHVLVIIKNHLFAIFQFRIRNLYSDHSFENYKKLCANVSEFNNVVISFHFFKFELLCDFFQIIVS